MKSIQGSNQRVDTFEKLVHLFIALILAGFLSALGNKVLNDLDRWYTAPIYTNYFDTTPASKINKDLALLNFNENRIGEKIAQMESGYNISLRIYNSEKESFDNWIKTRKTIGNPEQDSEIMNRLKKLDGLNGVKSSWQKNIDSFLDSLRLIQASKRQSTGELDKLKESATEKYNSDLRSYNLKIFLLRLIFSLPILVLGIFLFIKFRNNKYKAFIWGIIFFSLYVFFVGLVPYLPSYGGYVRYIVGIIVTIIIGYYLIQQIALYYERKNIELQKSMEERRDKIQYETAIKSYRLHTCPSCERDFYLTKDTDNKPNFCIHCGLLLFENCTNCGHRNYAHFEFCSSCGSHLKPKEKIMA
jgi:hypothetical protein